MVPTEWHESGYYGLHGAAGAMLSVVMDGERKFLLVKRASSTASQPGLWQLPGGALEAGETPREAAQRETMEEIAIPDLGGGSVVGEVVYEHRTGWKYTNYAVTVWRWFHSTAWTASKSRPLHDLPRKSCWALAARCRCFPN